MKTEKPLVAINPIKGSSAITGQGYDAERGILAVQFKGGKTYHYEGVPPDLVDGMAKAESIGKFVAANVVGKFDLYKDKK